MPYLPPMTIAACLADIQKRELALPAIQREFVWQPKQVTALFDSLMRGYPIGSFLSWKVEPATSQQFRFYGFLRDYNELNLRHNPQLDVPPTQNVKAVLDGQQRLTSLNIGLRGTYAYRNKYSWRAFAENYPARTLHLFLGGKAAENTAGLEYDFRFLTKGQLEAMDEEESRLWFPVPAVYDADDFTGLWDEMAKRQLGNDQQARQFVSTLWKRVHSDQSIYFYEETDQDIERVLDIFIRVNSGGTTLSYSDLLLSIATAQWKDRDARKEIHELVDDLNATGAGFRFSQDLVLKTGLVLAGVPDIGFKVKNFTSENMQLLSDRWDEIGASLRVAVGLLSDFGLSGSTLTAGSIVIPIATYVHHRGLTQSYRESPADAQDRAALREWTLRSLIVPGIWGSSLDQLLRALRDTIQQHGDSNFPARELERVMAARGKSLTVTPELVDGLMNLRYRDPSTFAVLAMLFPHVNTRNNHHVDHIFPTARLTKAKLARDGLAADVIDEIIDAKDRIANLELLEGLENISKSAKMPADWLAEHGVSVADTEAYLARNALPEIPAATSDFLGFIDAREGLLRKRLLNVMGARESEVATQAGTEDPLPSLDDSVEGGLLTER